MDSAARHYGRTIACVLVFASSGPVLLAQTSAITPGTSPSAWIQLRNGTDNAGVVPGTLDVTWRYRATRPVRGLSVAEGVVLIGTESADADAAPDAFSDDQRGFLTALDANTGKALWTRALPSWIHSDPAIYNGRGYATFGRWPMTYPGGVVAYDLRSGEKIWLKSTATGIMPAPALDTMTHVLLAAGGGGVLFELSLDSGREVHATGLRVVPAMSSPRITSDRSVIVGGFASILSYSLDRQAIIWTRRVAELNSLGDNPVALSDTVAFTAGCADYGFWKAARDLPFRTFMEMVWKAYHTKKLTRYRGWFGQQWLLAIDRHDGRELWRKPLGIGLGIERNTAGTPVVSGSRVIISSPVSRIVYAFDIGTGRELWRHALAAMHKGAVTVIGNDVLLGDRKGTVVLLDVRDGKPVGRCNAGGPFTVLAPVLVGRTLFTATKDGWVHAVPYDSLRGRAVRAGEKSCF